MDGLQGWHLVVLANLVIIAAVVFLMYWYFRGARKRRERGNAPPVHRPGDLDE